MRDILVFYSCWIRLRRVFFLCLLFLIEVIIGVYKANKLILMPFRFSFLSLRILKNTDSMHHVILVWPFIYISIWPRRNRMSLFFAMMKLSFIAFTIWKLEFTIGMKIMHEIKACVFVTISILIKAKTMILILLPFAIIYTSNRKLFTSSVALSVHKIALIKV